MQPAFRWIEWPKVERDSVILCLLPYRRHGAQCHSGTAPLWRCTNACLHVYPYVCAPAPQRQGLPVYDCTLWRYPSNLHSLLHKTWTFCQTIRLFRNFLHLRPLVTCTCIAANLSITSFNATVSSTLSSLPF